MGLCSVAGYLGVRFGQSWLIVLYMLWLVTDLTLNLLSIATDAAASTQTKILFIVFRLLMYGVPACLCARLLALLRWKARGKHRLQQLRANHASAAQRRLAGISAAAAASRAHAPGDEWAVPMTQAPASAWASSRRREGGPLGGSGQVQDLATAMPHYLHIQRQLRWTWGTAAVAVAGVGRVAPCRAHQIVPTT